MSSYDTLFGFSLTDTPWQCKIAKVLFDETGDESLKSLFGAQGWNTGLIDKLNRYSKNDLLPGADRTLYMTSNTGASEKVVASFLDHIEEYQGQDVREGIGATIDDLITGAKKSLDQLPGILKYLPVIVIGGVLLMYAPQIKMGGEAIASRLKKH
jgi:hypothetical protein